MSPVRDITATPLQGAASAPSEPFRPQASREDPASRDIIVRRRGNLLSPTNPPLQLEPPRSLAKPGLSPSPFTQEMARALLARRTLQANRIYVVSLDVNNTSVATAKMLKGTTYVFATDAGGAPRFYDSFRSSTQPTGGNPRDSWSELDPTYRFPYVRDGEYPMGTEIYGSTLGFIVGEQPDSPLPSYRDYDMNGRITDAERARPTTSDMIRIHRASLGSSGCHLIATDEWPRFRDLVQRLAAEGRQATYVFERHDPQRSD